MPLVNLLLPYHERFLRPRGSSLIVHRNNAVLLVALPVSWTLTPVNLGGTLTCRHFLRQISDTGSDFRRPLSPATCRPGGTTDQWPARDRITGSMRRRSTSQRCDRGSHTPPARSRIVTKSCGQGIATMAPSRRTRPGRRERAGGVSITPPHRRLRHASGSS